MCTIQWLFSASFISSSPPHPTSLHEATFSHKGSRQVASVIPVERRTPGSQATSRRPGHGRDCQKVRGNSSPSGRGKSPPGEADAGASVRWAERGVAPAWQCAPSDDRSRRKLKRQKEFGLICPRRSRWLSPRIRDFNGKARTAQPRERRWRNLRHLGSTGGRRRLGWDDGDCPAACAVTA